MASAQVTEGDVKYALTYAGKDVEQFKAMMPTATHIYFKGEDSKVITEGGMPMAQLGDVIVKGGEKMTYIVNHTNKTVNKFKNEEPKENNGKKPTVTKEDGTAKILGYNCQKYKVTMNSEKGGEMITYIWATKEIQVKRAGNEQLGAGKYMYEGVEGYPLKMEMNFGQTGMSFTMTMTATSVNLGSVPAGTFDIPADYKMEEGMPMLLKMQQGEK